MEVAERNMKKEENYKQEMEELALKLEKWFDEWRKCNFCGKCKYFGEFQYECEGDDFYICNYDIIDPIAVGKYDYINCENYCLKPKQIRLEVRIYKKHEKCYYVNLWTNEYPIERWFFPSIELVKKYINRVNKSYKEESIINITNNDKNIVFP